MTTVRDAGSLNGTYVNRERIDEAALSSGDEVQIGKFKLVYLRGGRRVSPGGARSYLSIGDVLTLLRQEFPDVTISKIRFLESQGLVNPERTPSGYRKFYEHDVERLRWVLRQQREHFLPLKVIKDRLDEDAVGADGDSGTTPAATRHPRRRRPPGAGAGGGREGRRAGAGRAARRRGPAAAAPSAPTPSHRRRRTAAPGRVDRAPSPGPRPAGPVHGADASGSRGSSRRRAPGPPDGRGGGPPAPADGSHPRRWPRRTRSRTPRRPTDRATAGEPASTGAAVRRPRSRRGRRRPTERPGPPPPAPRPGRTGRRPPSRRADRPGPRRVRHRPWRRRPTTPCRRGRRERRRQPLRSTTCARPAVSSEEYVAPAAGVRAAPGHHGGRRRQFFDEEALTVAKVAAKFAAFGIEARHLRLYKNAADREAGFIEQVVIPMVRQRNPEARARATQTAEDLAAPGPAAQGSLLRSALQRPPERVRPADPLGPGCVPEGASHGTAGAE